MDQTAYLIAGVAILVLIVVLLLLRGRRQRVSLGDAGPLARAAAPPRDEGQGVGSEVTAAIEDVVDQFVGLDAHPSAQPAAPLHGDALIRLKGLGPKAASRLAELGVTTYAQIAAWDEGDVAAIDREMGAFKGRIARDRWVEQARLLARGDTQTFEAEFGKLGD